MVTQLIYMSQPFGYDDAMLAGILAGARRNNRRDDVSGALVCRQDIYLQMIEGPQTAIDALYDRIRRDDRHIEVRQLWRREADHRLFPTWDMLHDPARSWLWTPAEITAGAVSGASPEDMYAVFVRIAGEISAD